MHKREGTRNKEGHSPYRLFLGMSVAVICVMLLFTGIGVVSAASSPTATITYDGTKILISGGTANLTTINETLNDPNLLEQLSPKEWLLKVPIQVSGAIFYINDTDCDWLKLQSLNDGNDVYIKGGTIEINNTKITSWNTTASSVQTSTYKRAGIFTEGGRINITNSNISYLGAESNSFSALATSGYGIVYQKADSYSIISNSTFKNVFAVRIYSSDNKVIRDSRFVNFGGDTKEECGGVTCFRSKNIIIKDNTFT
ncbi:hypothetical protein DRO38_04350, partial [Candidatus Bathyarchaeota archaeon]